MRASCFIAAFCFIALVAAPASGEGKAEILTFGNRSAPGIAVSSYAHRAEVTINTKQFSSTVVASQLPETSLVMPTNRCSATNVGGGFSYSFANGVECASFSAPVPGDPTRPAQRRPRPPSPEEVAARLFDRAVALAPTPELEVAPSGIGLAGLRTFFWLAETPEPIVATAAAGPATVTAVADPVQYLWDFGDGGDRLTETPGTSWTLRRRGSIGHVYQASGRYDLGVEVIWQARWRSGGGAWQPLGYFSTADSRPYRVREVIAWLVRQR